MKPPVSPFLRYRHSASDPLSDAICPGPAVRIRGVAPVALVAPEFDVSKAPFRGLFQALRLGPIAPLRMKTGKPPDGPYDITRPRATRNHRNRQQTGVCLETSSAAARFVSIRRSCKPGIPQAGRSALIAMTRGLTPQRVGKLRKRVFRKDDANTMLRNLATVYVVQTTKPCKGPKHGNRRMIGCRFISRYRSKPGKVMVMTREADECKHKGGPYGGPNSNSMVEPYRDDALVLDIVTKAIVEFHIRCDFASSTAVERLGFEVNDGDRAQVTLGIIKDATDACAQLIITRLEEAGFAVGSFR